MNRKPSLINNFDKIGAVRNSSLEYLDKYSELQEKIADHISAYYEIGNLVPETLYNVGSGHTFPYFESYYELENSYQLCLEGFYTYAFVALRSVLELGILGVYFAVEDKEYEEIQPWITSQEPTPRFRNTLRRLKKLKNFKQFDKRFYLVKRISDTYSNLSDFVHTRGFHYSSTGQTHSNFNRFFSDKLNKYCDFMFSVVSNIIITILLKYPIGMQPLPLTKKFGFNVPVGGFLEDGKVDIVTLILRAEEKEFLKTLSDKDPDVKGILEDFESLPDLSEQEWQQQLEEFDREHPAFRNLQSHNAEENVSEKS